MSTTSHKTIIENAPAVCLDLCIKYSETNNLSAEEYKQCLCTFQITQIHAAETPTEPTQM